MTPEELRDILASARTFGAEAADIEAKKAESNLPKSCKETLSSFSNTPGGGTLILGVNEDSGFAVTGTQDAGKMQADLAAMCRTEISPPLSPTISIINIDEKNVVVAEVSELPREQKPAYCISLGMNRGSFIRVGEGDRRLTPEEVQQLISDRGQPLFDQEAVPGSSLSDLDARAVDGYVERMRTSNPRIFGDAPQEVILRMTRVTIKSGDDDLLTMGGLLALGLYPQQYFPQLNLTFVHFPTTSGESTSTGVRFLDNVSINGSIPVMAKEALQAIQRNMSKRALIVGEGRRDVWEYPPEALREAIVNALVHRDLSPGSRGTQVQVEMYPDRLRILNSGGLFGALDIERLGEEGRSSARNSLLMKLLEDVTVPGEDRTVCENRGSGIRAMNTAFRQAGMSPPRFSDRTTSFEVTMPNHTLLDDDTVKWLTTLGREGLRDSQCIALSLMRRGEVLDNSKYRSATGVNDSRAATFELQDLVARELVDQTGIRGGARYTLSDYAASAGREGKHRSRPDRRRQITQLLSVHGELSKAQISELLNLNPKTAEHWIRTLKNEGKVEPTQAGQGQHAKYRLSSQLGLDDAQEQPEQDDPEASPSSD
ncbi:ATP-binding protein [Streptomyces sp. JJ36]|uniref:ATP-binding protein n=1 Tax=Streptomyces sp. JJ36 TaxID=2736645 RepID=UPI001F27892C|nr:ATP-binding protein [Streptomyces sp. JJ36]MCF6525256.1 putative DNA binding domain-containing protein [Streptomyces sp. JJ36]